MLLLHSRSASSQVAEMTSLQELELLFIQSFAHTSGMLAMSLADFHQQGKEAEYMRPVDDMARYAKAIGCMVVY